MVATLTFVADTMTPVRAYAALRRAAGDAASFLLESVIGGERWGRYSILGYEPKDEVTLRADGVWVGVYWSRTLAAAVAVGLAPTASWPADESVLPVSLLPLLPAGTAPDLLETVRERNVQGRLYELPGLDRNSFPG